MVNRQKIIEKIEKKQNINKGGRIKAEKSNFRLLNRDHITQLINHLPTDY